jgi:hypothetical protein
MRYSIQKTTLASEKRTPAKNQVLLEAIQSPIFVGGKN